MQKTFINCKVPIEKVSWGQSEKEQRLRVTGTSLAVQWLAHPSLMAEGPDLLSGQGTKIPQVSWHGQKKKKNQSQCILATVQASPHSAAGRNEAWGTHLSPTLGR